MPTQDKHSSHILSVGPITPLLYKTHETPTTTEYFNSSTRKLINSKTHQLINSLIHQLANSQLKTSRT